MHLREIRCETYLCIARGNAVENSIPNLGHGYLHRLGNDQLAVEMSATSVSVFNYKLQYVSIAALGSA